MYPKPPDCTRKWIHGARILPFLPRKACMRRRCCQEGGLLRAFGGKGDAYGAILASWALGPPQCKEGMRGFMGRRGGWRRWRAAMLADGGAGASNAAGSGVGRTGTAGAAVVSAAVQGRRWWARRCGCCVRGGATVRGHGDGDSTGTHGATGAMEAGDSWPRGVGPRSAQYASTGGGYSPKLASIAATRSSSAPMSCWFTSSIFCKSAGEAFST